MCVTALATEARAGKARRLVIFLSGDDEEAKSVVSHLIEEIGFAPLDTGSLREGGRRQQPDSPLYNHPMNLKDARHALQHLEALPKAA